jgi:hypothetical protein
MKKEKEKALSRNVSPLGRGATVARMFLARDAYLRVFLLSSAHPDHGETCAIMALRMPPPRASLSSRVSLESRYGTKAPRRRRDDSVLMQLPSASRDRLMAAPSRCVWVRARELAASLPRPPPRSGLPL